jgi:UDP-glucose 4-epimerase
MNKVKKPRRALVTGGAGFIGSHLCEELLSRGVAVTVLDDLSTGRRENIAGLLKNKKCFEFCRGTIMDEKLMAKLIKRSDIVYHLAAAVGVKLILKKAIDSMLTNIEGTEIVLKLADKYRKKVLITSTSEVYGKHICEPLIEAKSNEVIGPTSVGRWSYASSKATDEFLGLAYAKERKLPVIIVRLFNAVGPRQSSRYGMVLPTFVREALSNKPITIYGDGTHIRSFTHVKDAVRAIIELSFSRDSLGQIFNVGSDEHVSIKDLAKKIKVAARSGSPIRFKSFKKAYGKDYEDTPCRICDLTRIKKVIGYKPRYSLDDVITDTIKYFQERIR